VCISEEAECLLHLGRLDEAALKYQEAISINEQLGAERDLAVSKFWLGSVRLQQRRYEEALGAYEEARERFMALGEPGTIAQSWHQTGMVYEGAGQPEAAEDAYRKSLTIKVRLGDVPGQGDTLLQLGNLYFAVLGRPEEAVTFYRQAADKFIESGDAAKEAKARNNLSATLRNLHRLDEARQEIRRAMECQTQSSHATEPWITWDNLADIETDASDPAAAAEAKGKAIVCYLAYRRDGGENYDTEGRISLAVTQSLLANDSATAASLLEQRAPRFEAAGFGGFIRALQAIVAGSRDRTLAGAPDLHYTMAAEILFLIETLEKPR